MKQKRNCKRQDLTGEKFNHWQVLGPGKDRETPKGRILHYWICQCDCKKHTIKEVEGNSLTRGKSKSCGCALQPIMQNINQPRGNKYDLTREYGIGYASNDENIIFLFDLEDYEKIKDCTWGFHKSSGYIVTVGKDGENPFPALHTFIMQEKEIDHINRNKLDNRKENLRKASHILNSYNRSKHKNNTSGFMGVGYIEERGSWTAYITTDRKTQRIKTGKDKIAVLRYRLQAEYDLMGPEWAPQRHLFEEYKIPDKRIHEELIKRGKIPF